MLENYALIETHFPTEMAALLFMLRLMAIAFLGHADKVAQVRLNVIDDINEEVDLFG